MKLTSFSGATSPRPAEKHLRSAPRGLSDKLMLFLMMLRRRAIIHIYSPLLSLHIYARSIAAKQHAIDMKMPLSAARRCDYGEHFIIARRRSISILFE